MSDDPNCQADDRMMKSEREITLCFAEERAKYFGWKFESGSSDSLKPRQTPRDV